MPGNLSSPVSLSERSDILDVLRGFALFGVLMDNLMGFSGWGEASLAYKQSLSTWPADGVLGLFELAFINGKFYSLFSLLFGVGFSIILMRNEQRGTNPLKIFYRRLLILMCFGAIHLFLLWEGDILTLYALIGLFLPLFRKCSDKTLVITAVALILSPILIDTLKIIFHFRTGEFLNQMGQAVDKKTGIPLDDSFAQYLYKDDAGWKEWRNWQASGFYYRYGYIIESNRIPKVLGMFLLGFYAGRKMIYANLESYTSLFKTLRKWGFIIGIPFALLLAYCRYKNYHPPMTLGILDTISYALSVVPLCLAYMSTICLIWIRKKGNTKIKVLAPMGRMALTNYITQTLLGISIYYGVGLGIGGDIGPSVFMPLGLAVYVIQILYSNAWFRYFYYGPLEWIWRMLTYGRRLKFVK